MFVSSSEVENKKELIEIKADRLPIGKHDRDHIPFTLHTLNLQKGDVVYRRYSRRMFFVLYKGKYVKTFSESAKRF